MGRDADAMLAALFFLFAAPVKGQSQRGIPMHSPTDEQVIDAIHKARGLVSAAAQRLGVSRRTIYNRRNKSDAVANALTEAREVTTDIAEAKLFEQIEAGNITAILFYLKCQAKRRGYVERSEVEIHGAGGGPIELTLADSQRRFLSRMSGLAARIGASGVGTNGDGGNDPGSTGRDPSQ